MESKLVQDLNMGSSIRPLHLFNQIGDKRLGVLISLSWVVELEENPSSSPWVTIIITLKMTKRSKEAFPPPNLD